MPNQVVAVCFSREKSPKQHYFKKRIIFRQKLRDEKTSEEDQENIEIYVVNNTFDLLKTDFIFGEITDIQFPLTGH